MARHRTNSNKRAKFHVCITAPGPTRRTACRCRGMCVLLPRTLPRLIPVVSRCGPRPGHRTRDKDTRSSQRTHLLVPHHSPSRDRTHPCATRHQIVAPPSLHLSDSAAATVFRRRATARPGRAATSSPRSPHCRIATVNRQVTALLEAGLLRERADLAVSGAIGRPRVPVEVNHEPFVTLGIHIGARTTSIVATDLFGRTLDTVETPTPRDAAGPALASLADSAARYLSRWHRRRPLWVGVAIGGVVDSATGHVDHPRLGWTTGAGRTGARRDAGSAGVGGRPTSTRWPAPNCCSACGDSRRRRPTSLYVYARETVGYALVIGGRVHCPASGPGTIATLPAQSELLGGIGPAGVDGQRRGGAGRRAPAAAAAAATGDRPMGRRVHRPAAASPGPATSRPRICSPSGPGCSARRLRCCVTCSTPTIWWSAARRSPNTRRGWSTSRRRSPQRSVLPPRDIRVTAFGNRVQEAGAGVVSLGGLYADPLGAMRRAGRAGSARRTPTRAVA